ncbi:hypothetical protein VOLCADRAFT_91352 [Volvox carteri f. nagariensis]|uniref:Uncharacterized protein n=1 Tax=Volvox carteri f. nagariensis TaxID=3068 RepID=D8TWU7_VOLCA|nr:uncharacterized protein VOLCADRAFT_91352 [Volvox carteri f. nagariensis]EFJ48111.1 hypothetical protein VOLCADRAFT_91352 [Volvox carteri f. nagariensis]|eukprot:XP_002950796.1 hypothetical protein VOLCADRAFT_91352 [Volvox carteri f. nagariensis]
MVRQVEFHPVLPWIVSATKSDNVSVWDWRTRQVVWEAQLGSGTDGDLCAEAELACVHVRDPAFTPNPSLMHPIPSGPKKEPTGHVRDVRFLDCDVAQVQLTWQHTSSSGCGTPGPRAEEIRALRGQRLLVIACENKVIVVDLASRRVLELGKGVFEGKTPTSLAFLFRAGRAASGHAGFTYGGGTSGGGGGSMGLLESPVLAVGCSDGIVRCVQLFPIKQPVARLISAHKTAVVAMAVLGMLGQRHETLAVGHAGGRVVLFEPLSGTRAGGSSGGGAGLGAAGGGGAATSSPGSGGGASASMADGVSPRAEYRAHEREMLPGSLVLVPVNEDPEDRHFRLFSAGSDNRVCGLDLAVLRSASPSSPSLELVRTKVEGAALTCLAHWPRGFTSNGVYSLLMGTEGGSLLLAHPGGGEPRRAVDLAGLIPAGTVLCVTAATLPNHDLVDFTPNQVMGKLQVASGTPVSRPLVTVSHDGGYVAVAWPGARKYAVYQQGASAWKEVAQGTGSSVAWHSGRDVFAALEETLPAALSAAAAGAAVSPGKHHKDPRKAEKQAAAAAAAAEAAARAAADSAAVRVKEFYGGGTPMGMGVSLDLRGDTPSFVQGGPLLAVTVRRGLQSEAADLAPAGSFTPALLLFDWSTGRRAGPELPEPLHLSWDPARTMLALAYPSQLLIIRARPIFQVAASLPVCGAESLEWSARQLFIATPSHILCALVSPNPPNLPPSSPATALVAAAATSAGGTAAAAAAAATSPSARLITLAAPGVSAAIAGGAGSGGLALEGLLPPPAVRPPGPLVLLGPRDGCLWMVGVLGQPMALGLSHPGLRCFSMVAAGDLHGAVSLASRALVPELHDQLAGLMVEMDGLGGAAAAANLPGITLHMELRLRAALRHWQQAVEAAEALLLGYTRRPAAGLFRSVVAAAAFGSGGVGVGGPQLGEEFVDLSMAEGGAPAHAPAHPEDLDWTQPLRAAASSAKAAATAVVAARRPGGGGSGGVGTTGSSPGAALVLGLMEDLQRAAQYDVVRHLVKPLLVHAVYLGGDQLRTLAGIMAQVGMKTDLPSLLHSVAAGADSSNREAAALLAAMLSGHTALVQDSLRDDGAQPLAALQARVYGLSSTADSMAAWRRQLAAAAPPGAAAALGRLDVSDPVAAPDMHNTAPPSAMGHKPPRAEGGIRDIGSAFQ